MASTVPARASSTARSTAWAATRPASSGRRACGALRSSLPSTVTSAPRGPSARAFAVTSGPMPRGSPTGTARRGRATRLGADVDVRRAAQDLEVVLYRELLADVLGGPNPLNLDHVIAELRRDRVGDLTRPHPERHVLELLDHRAAAEPSQLAALLPRRAVGGVPLGHVREAGAVAQHHDERLGELA